MSSGFDVRVPQNTGPIVKSLQNPDSDNLLSYVTYLTLDRFKPNKDNGISYFYGIITNIITQDTKNCDVRDIFNSITDQIERRNLTTTKDNSARTMYFVHIPALHSILFSSETPLNQNKSELSPEDLYKFRIEKSTPDGLKIGNIVKVKFQDQTNFLYGSIEEKVEDNILQLKTDPKDQQEAAKKFEKYCVQPPLEQAKGQGRVLYTKVISYEDVTNVGLYDFLETFVQTISKDAEQKFLPNNQTSNYIIYSSKDTYSQIVSFNNENENFNKVGLSVALPSQDKYIILADDAITAPNSLRIEVNTQNQSTKSNLIYYFSQYLKASFNIESIVSNNFLSINLKISKDVITPSGFYDYSVSRYDLVKQYNIYPQQTEAFQEPNKTANESKPANNEKCEDDLTTIESYINTTSDSWKRANKDRDVINFFFNKTPINSNSPIMKNYQKYSISNSFNVINLDLFPKEEVVKKSPDFYSVESGLKEINGLSGEGEEITIDSLQNNLKQLRKDMNTLQKYISLSEGVSDQNVLILPIKWFVPKTSVADDNVDDNSQLWYGRSVQFVVYIRLNDGIYQIPPEIVYLYVIKSIGEKRSRIGMGIFSSDNCYIQYENLDGISVENPEPRFWTAEPPNDELEKELSKVSPNDFTETIKTYVSIKYLSNISNNMSNKIRNLL